MNTDLKDLQKVAEAMRGVRVLFASDDVADEFYREVTLNVLMGVGALRAAHCDVLAGPLLKLGEYLAGQHFGHFHDRIRDAGKTVSVDHLEALNKELKTALERVDSARLAQQESEQLAVKLRAELDAAKAAAPVKRVKNRNKSPAPPVDPEREIEDAAIVFSEGDLKALSKHLQGLAVGTREQQRAMQLARAETGYAGLIPEAPEPTLRAMAKQVKLLELRNKKFNTAAPAAQET